MKHRILESSKHKLPCEVPTTIVLCQLTKAGPDEDMMEFATWVQCWGEGEAATGYAETLPTTQRAGLVSGHYFDNLQDALNDYHKRADAHHRANERAKK